MSRRTYDQPGCGLAVALDLLGERWTLLIVRELMVGPLRYTDLLSCLPAIGTNLLSRRLRHLEEVGVVQRTELPPPAASTVYELSERGRGLEDALTTLAEWGDQFVDHEVPRPFDPRHEAFALRRAFEPGAAAAGADNEARYQFEVDSAVLHARLVAGRVETGLGPIPQPTVTIRTDATTWETLLRCGWADGAVAPGAVDVDGDIESVRRLFRFRSV